MHAQSIIVSGDGEHRGTEIIEALIHPLGGLAYPPPTVEIRLQLFACHDGPRRSHPYSRNSTATAFRAMSTFLDESSGHNEFTQEPRVRNAALFRPGDAPLWICGARTRASRAIRGSRVLAGAGIGVHPSVPICYTSASSRAARPHAYRATRLKSGSVS